MLPSRKLGSTGLSVSCLSLGTVKIGRTQGLKHPDAFDLPTDAQAAALLDAAAEVGITLLDTAPAYGVSEERLGALLSAGAGGGRSGFLLCTKAGEEFAATADGRGSSTFDFSESSVEASVRRSLERLRTDVLDIVLLHSDGRDAWVLRESGALRALRRLQKAGAIRAVGASTKTPEGALLAVDLCDVVMVTLNPEEMRDLPAITAAGERGVGVLAKKPLASGRLRGIGTAGQADPVAASLRLSLGNPAVSSVVVGTLSPEHLRQNALAANQMEAD
ncbi:MAG: aldo/keto reductase [Phycisphaeraceae bacterium]|nr:aldo/keto reductase [Phycisphaeraceae bacterium]